MDELSRALEDITSIRRQVALNAEFRGLGAATLACTGVFAVAAAAIQAMSLPEPSAQMTRYLLLWLTTAVLSAGVIAVQTWTRARRMHSGMADEMIYMAVEQFVPAALAGILLTLVLVKCAPQSLWMVPGLWQVVYSLGVCSSCRFLPRPMLLAGGWFLVTGLFCLALGDTRALNPWAMGVPFGVGQMLVAAVVHLHREDGDGD